MKPETVVMSKFAEETGDDAPARPAIREIDIATVRARQAIGVFDLGSGGMVAAEYLSRILRDSGEKLSVIFGDTFAKFLPTLSARSESRSYFAFSGERPPNETFMSLGLDQVDLAKQL